MKKRMLAMILALVMCLAMAAPALAAEPASGKFGTQTNNLTWNLDANGTLTISGTGAMSSSTPSIMQMNTKPWSKQSSQITAVVINNGVTQIGSDAFSYCENLISVSIPNSVTSIAPRAFMNCTGLTSINLPSGLKSIGGGAFAGCTGLTSVKIPDSVTEIGDSNLFFSPPVSGAFAGCTSLTSVTIPNSVTKIGSNAFAGCTSLTSVAIPESVTEIGSGAFSVCSSLTSITIPDGVTEIQGKFGPYGATVYGTFNRCSSLTSVTIPASVTKINSGAFNGCGNLKDVYYYGTEEQWKSVEIAKAEYDGGIGEVNNDPLLKATIHYNGTTTPTQPTNPTPSTNLPTVEQIPAKGTAVARTQTVKLDGKDMQFQYYAVKDASGNESNYVKVRDLANALNGTKAQFNVGWNGKISITSGTAYQVAGGEGTTPYSGNQNYTAVSDTPVSFNGSDVKLTSFQLKDSKGNGYTYYKLRDLGQLLNFNVKWDGGVVVETDKPYTGK